MVFNTDAVQMSCGMLPADKQGSLKKTQKFKGDEEVLSRVKKCKCRLLLWMELYC